MYYYKQKAHIGGKGTDLASIIETTPYKVLQLRPMGLFKYLDTEKYLFLFTDTERVCVDKSPVASFECSSDTVYIIETTYRDISIIEGIDKKNDL